GRPSYISSGSSESRSSSPSSKGSNASQGSFRNILGGTLVYQSPTTFDVLQVLGVGTIESRIGRG
ncbi:hypothetical protein BgiMline_000227, partial [Biomphalaria glabrata]